MSSDPFAVLGLGPQASIEELRLARRRLARSSHPDVGGSQQRMQEINAAYQSALTQAALRQSQNERQPDSQRRPQRQQRPSPTRRTFTSRTPSSLLQWDSPSFTVDVEPQRTFEVLRSVAATHGEVVDESAAPVHELEVVLRAPMHCWCLLVIGPLPGVAGASSIDLCVAPIVPGHPAPDVDDVRDQWTSWINTGY